MRIEKNAIVLVGTRTQVQQSLKDLAEQRKAVAEQVSVQGSTENQGSTTPTRRK